MKYIALYGDVIERNQNSNTIAKQNYMYKKENESRSYKVLCKNKNISIAVFKAESVVKRKRNESSNIITMYVIKEIRKFSVKN